MSGPILVFGLPRSGTTWLGKIFDSHPETLYRHEPDSVRRLSMPLFPDVRHSECYAAELEAFVSGLPDMRLPKVVAKGPIFPKRYLSSPALMAYRAGVMLSRLSGQRAQRHNVPFSPTAAGYMKRRVVWKSIESLGRLGVCARTLPTARIIFILRHPGGYVASVQRGEGGSQFSSDTPASEDYGVLMQLLQTQQAKIRGMTLQDLQSMKPDERLAWRWTLISEKAKSDTADADSVLMVRYEDLCSDPVSTVNRMFEFTGLDMRPETLAFIDSTASRGNGSYYSIYRNPATAATRWQTELAPEMIDRVCNVLKKSSLTGLYDAAPSNVEQM